MYICRIIPNVYLQAVSRSTCMSHSAKETYKRDDILQKRLMILGSLKSKRIFTRSIAIYMYYYSMSAHQTHIHNIYIYTHMFTRIYIYTYTCTHVFVCTRMYIYIHVNTCAYSKRAFPGSIAIYMYNYHVTLVGLHLSISKYQSAI